MTIPGVAQNPRYRFQGLLPRIREYVHAAFLAGEPTTLNAAARALGETRPASDGLGVTYTTPIRTAFDHFERQGIALLDPVLSTPSAPVYAAWNWSGLPLEGQTLRTALESFLQAPIYKRSDPVPAMAQVTLADGRARELTPTNREDVYLLISAVRALVRARFGEEAAGVKGSGGRERLLAACARIPLGELPNLPHDAKAAAGDKADVGEKYHTAIVGFLRYAAAHDLIALPVRAPASVHPWATWAAKHNLSHHDRTTLYKLHSALTAIRGNAAAADPEVVAVSDANVALEWIEEQRSNRRAKQGFGKRAASDLRALLKTLGLAGQGPYRALQGCSLVKSGRQALPAWMLATQGDQPQGFESTIDLLRAHGFGAEYESFYAWYADYCLLDAAALRARHDIERHDPVRHLDPSTSRQRHQALRVWLGIATAPIPVGLGLASEHATKAVVFGTRFRDIIALLRTAWRQRVEEQRQLADLGLRVPGHRVSYDSPTVDRHIINAGLIADAMATWATECATKGRPVATAEEIAAWKMAYEASGLATQPTADSGRSTLRSRKRTQKDVAKIAQDLSSLALLAAEQRRVRRLIETAPEVKETAAEMQRYIMGALIGMGSPRVGELGILEYRRHWVEEIDQAVGRQEVRGFRVPGEHRKAGGDHSYALIEAIVPRAFQLWHQANGRVLLMKPWIAAGRSAHDFVFCSPENGGPFGGTPDYAGISVRYANDARRREIALIEAIDRCINNASAGISAQYEQWRRDALHRLEQRGAYTFSAEETRGHHKAHGGRNQILRLLNELGLQEHTALVMGHKTKQTSDEMYGCSHTALIARVMQQIMDAAPWNRPAGPEVHVPATISGLRSKTQREREQMERDAALGRTARSLLQKHVAGDLSPKQAAAQLDQIAKQFGVDVKDG